MMPRTELLKRVRQCLFDRIMNITAHSSRNVRGVRCFLLRPLFQQA